MHLRWPTGVAALTLTVVGCACGVAIGLSITPVSAQSGPALRAFTGMRLWDGTGSPPIADATLLVRDGRVVAAGPSPRVSVPPGTERVSLAGRHVIPGLINAHGHVNDAARDLATYAAYGVTTVYSLGDEPEEAFAARAGQRHATLARSRVFLAGPVLSPKTPDEARTLVAANHQRGVDIIKIRVDDNLGTTPKMAPEIYRAVIEESHTRGLRTAVHLFYRADAAGVLDAGADLIAHSVRDLDVDPAVIDRLKARNICVVPTLMREVSTFAYESAPAFFADRQFLAHANPTWLADLKTGASQERFRASTSAHRYKTALEVAKRNVGALARAGVTLAMGTDTGPVGRFQGYFEWMELDLMVEAGLTPTQALLSATRDAARCQKLEGELGTLEPGKWADFLVLNADPLAEVRHVRRLDGVYIAGNRLAAIAR